MLNLNPFGVFFPFNGRVGHFRFSHLHSRTKDLTLRFFLANQHYINKQNIQAYIYCSICTYYTLLGHISLGSYIYDLGCHFAKLPLPVLLFYGYSKQSPLKYLILSYQVESSHREEAFLKSKDQM